MANADVVLLNSLVFEAALMSAMAQVAEGASPGTLFLTTQLLPSEEFQTVGDSDELFELFDTAAMTEPTVYFQRRI